MENCISDAAAVARDGLAGEERARKERADCRVSKEGLYDSIVAHFGVLSYVALAVGITRQALYKRIDRDPELQAARDGALRVLVQVATSHLSHALRAGAEWAVHFLMCREEGIWVPFQNAGSPPRRRTTRPASPIKRRGRNSQRSRNRGSQRSGRSLSHSRNRPVRACCGWSAPWNVVNRGRCGIA